MCHVLSIEIHIDGQGVHLGMPKRIVTERDEVLAALLFGDEGRSQADIAQQLGFSPAVISRILARAEGKYIERRITFLRDKIPAQLLAEVETVFSKRVSEELARLTKYSLGVDGPKVRVFEVDKKASREEYLAAFTKAAAPYIFSLISQAEMCGFTWGRMLANFVAAVKDLGIRVKSATECIPLAGEPLGFAATSSSSSLISEELQQILRGPGYPTRSLTMLPALIPRDFDPHEREIIKKLIGRLRGYREIFLGDSGLPPIASSLDALVTSVGRDPLGFRGGSLLHELEEQPLFSGDIGGVLIPRSPAEVAGGRVAQVMADLSDRWTGLRLEHVKSCAANARAKGAVGVVVVSIGEARASVVFECVRLGLVNHLVIDRDLENALLQVCRARAGR